MRLTVEQSVQLLCRVYGRVVNHLEKKDGAGDVTGCKDLMATDQLRCGGRSRWPSLAAITYVDLLTWRGNLERIACLEITRKILLHIFMGFIREFSVDKLFKIIHFNKYLSYLFKLLDLFVSMLKAFRNILKTFKTYFLGSTIKKIVNFIFYF